MAKTLPVTFADGDTLPASDLNTSFQTFTTNTHEIVSPMEGNISGASTYKLTSLAAGSANGDSVRYEQLGWNLITAQSASASATILFTSGLTSTYNVYKILITDLVPAVSGSSLFLRVSQSGVFVSGATNYHNARMAIDTGGTVTPAGDPTSTEIIVAESIGIAGFGAEITFYNPAGASLVKLFRTEATFVSVTGGNVFSYVTGGGSFRENAAAIDGIALLMNSGNITSGHFALYGVRKT